MKHHGTRKLEREPGPIDLIRELTEIRSEAPEAHVFLALRYPSGRSTVAEAIDPHELVAYANQVRHGAARLLTIYALTAGNPEPVVRSYGTIDEELEGLKVLVAHLGHSRTG